MGKVNPASLVICSHGTKAGGTMGIRPIDRDDEHCCPGPGWLLMSKYGNSVQLGRRPLPPIPTQMHGAGRATSSSRRPVVVAGITRRPAFKCTVSVRKKSTARSKIPRSFLTLMRSEREVKHVWTKATRFATGAFDPGNTTTIPVVPMSSPLRYAWLPVSPTIQQPY